MIYENLLTYYDNRFVSQMCCQVPISLLDIETHELTMMSAKLSLSYLLETLVHSKEKVYYNKPTVRLQ